MDNTELNPMDQMHLSIHEQGIAERLVVQLHFMNLYIAEHTALLCRAFEYVF